MIPVKAIERVIDDFETIAQNLMARKDSLFFVGAVAAFNHAAQELRKVVDDYGASKP